VRKLLPLLALIALCGSGCSTAVGYYFGNRAKDFGECFRLNAGLGVGLGVDAKVAGLLHVGFSGGVSSPRYSMGWRYGAPFAFGLGDPGGSLIGDVHTPVSHYLAPDGYKWLLHMGEAYPTRPGGRRTSVHGCYWFLPAAFSGVNKKWLWSEQARPPTWERLHIFDIELGATLGFVHAQAGFSPGEFVDFVLGWFGVDIADDDIPFVPPKGG
jgi:hypothetical protein